MRQILKKHRLVAALLAAAMIFTLLPVTVLAAGDHPELTVAAVNSSGDLELTFDAGMADPSGNVSAFAVVRSDGVPSSISQARLKSGDDYTIELIMEYKIRGGQTFRVQYVPGTVQADADGRLLEAIPGFLVTNSLPHPTISSPVPPDGGVGTPYTHTFTATGGTGATYSFTRYSGTLPPGLTLIDGVLSGTPTTAGSYTFRIQASDIGYAIDIKQYTMEISGGDTTPPAFESGYPRPGNPQAAGSRQVRVTIHTLESAYYHMVLLPNDAPIPSSLQVRNGLDAASNAALNQIDSGTLKVSDIDTGTFGPQHDTEYDIYVILRDDAGNLSEPRKVDVRTPPAAAGTNVCAIGGTEYPTLDAAITAALAGQTTTITLLQDITDTGGISVTGKNIIFELGTFNLTVDTTGNGVDKALDVVDGSVSYTGTGSFNVTGDGGYTVKVYSANAPASATVTSATATGDEGFAVHAQGENASVVVNGPVSATHPNRGYGVYAEGGSSVSVTGNVSAAMYGVIASSGSTVVVGGNVSTTASNSRAIASYDNSTVEVQGNATASGEDSVGAVASYGAEITIDGVLTATGTYIILEDEIPLNAGDHDETTTKPGYLTYSNMVSEEAVTSVWIGNQTPSPEAPANTNKNRPRVVTEGVEDVTVSGGAFLGRVVSSGGATVRERGFVLSTEPNPQLGKWNVIEIPSGSGTGNFTADAFNLLPATTYYVRAYAINSQGTAYGETLNFTTGYVGDAQNAVPKTGDSSAPFAGWLLLGVPALALIMLAAFRKKKGCNSNR